jgi:hypothetical protein
MKAKWVLCAAAMLGLSACGGGGGSDPSAPTTPAAQDLQSAPLPSIVWDAAILPTNDASTTLTGGGYTITFDTTGCVGDPPGCLFTNWSLVQTSNPANGTLGINTVNFTPSPYVPMSCACYSQNLTVTSWTPPPHFDVGASSQLMALSATNPTDTMVETYTVTAYSSTAVLVTIAETGQQATDNQSESYTVDASGNEQLVSFTGTLPSGQSIVFTP